MKSLFSYPTLILLLLITAFSSCQAIGDIFKAGVWVGVIIVVAVIGIIIWAAGRAGK
jgi:hypothetical protein